MANIAPIGSVSLARLAAPEAARFASRPEAAAPRRAPDRAEFSPPARWLSKLRNLDVRADLVETARQQIAAGTYVTEARIDGAIEELLEDLG